MLTEGEGWTVVGGVQFGIFTLWLDIHFCGRKFTFVVDLHNSITPSLRHLQVFEARGEGQMEGRRSRQSRRGIARDGEKTSRDEGRRDRGAERGRGNAEKIGGRRC